MRKYLSIIGLVLIAILLLAVGVTYYLFTKPDVARLSTAELSGRVPVLTSPRPEVVPTIHVAEAVGWSPEAKPRTVEGLVVTRFAEGLHHPRSLLVLPNGDVLVAQATHPKWSKPATANPAAQANSPDSDSASLTDQAAAAVQDYVGAGGDSANLITLLRDSDGDGRAEVRSAYISGLYAPYGMALHRDRLYVANSNALVAFPYRADAMRITEAGEHIADLPAAGGNRHWTKSLVLAPDGKHLYIGVGSDSDVAENGMEHERERAAILEVEIATKAKRLYASGLRNPVGLAFHPRSGDLWTVVNERDALGSDMVPDYLTEVDFGEFYGWPWYYWGGYSDPRVPAPAEDMRQYVRRPDYALGAHVAPLGIAFSNRQQLGERWSNGLFVALHGSWNRYPMAGYSVVFVPFNDKHKPAEALPVTILDGFIADDESSGFFKFLAGGEKKIAYGRPADVKIAKDGSLLVADDVGGVIWRISKSP